jgi:fido (protein-threonine AMPylation protein)
MSGRSAAVRELLSEKFVKDLHRRMLGDVWRWGGKFEFKAYPPDAIAVRFHHRLIQIHPFPNGNGRHSRLMADHDIGPLLAFARA